MCPTRERTLWVCYLVVFCVVYTRYCGLGGLYGPDKTSFILISIMYIQVNLTEEYIRLLMEPTALEKNAIIVISFWPRKKNHLFNWSMQRPL